MGIVGEIAGFITEYALNLICVLGLLMSWEFCSKTCCLVYGLLRCYLFLLYSALSSSHSK